MNKIKILSTSNISGNFANTIQIMKMADAFSKIDFKVEIYLPGRDQSLSSLVFQLKFGIKNDFKINFIPNISVRKKFGIISFAMAAYLKSRKWDEGEMIITRNERMASFLIKTSKNILYENHTFYYPSDKVTQKYRQRVKSLMKDKRVCMVVISNRLKELWTDFGLNPEKIFVAHDGVDLDEFQKIANYDKKQLRVQLKRQL